MSGPWIRGSRCGVDNCRSRHYRSVDGRRICQYGHVNEGHIDYNDDDDDNFVVTRRLNIPQSQTGMSQGSQITPGLEKDESKRRLFGSAARELYFKCFQTILKLQIQALIKDHGLPEIIDTIVKNIYLKYLNAFFNSNEAVESSGYETTDTQYTSDDDDQSRNFKFKKLPSHIDTLSICYLSVRYLNLPIYLNDFVQWATSRNIPYMRASHDLPKNLKDHLPIIMLKLFDPSRPPLKGDLCNSVGMIVEATGLKLELNYQPLLFKTIKNLVLSPEIYFAVVKFIKIHNIEFKIEPTKIHKTKTRNPYQKTKTVIYTFPEIKLMTILISITKLYFSTAYDREDRLQYDWKTWCEILKERKSNGTWSGDSNNLLSSLLVSKDSLLDVVDWNDKQTDEYLDWFTNKLLDHPDNSNISLQMKRLYDIFPLKDQDQDLDFHIQDEDSKMDLDLDDDNTKMGADELMYQTIITAPIEFPIPLKDEEATIIENILVENLFVTFGVTENQLRRALRRFESKYLKV